MLSPLRWFYYFAWRRKEMRLNIGAHRKVDVTKRGLHTVTFAVVCEGTLWSSKQGIMPTPLRWFYYFAWRGKELRLNIGAHICKLL